MAQPREIFEFCRGQDSPFTKLNQKLNKYKIRREPACDLPDGIFKTGWVGYFSYELAGFIEHFLDERRLATAAEAARRLALDYTLKGQYARILKVLQEAAEEAHKPDE